MQVSVIFSTGLAITGLRFLKPRYEISHAAQGPNLGPILFSKLSFRFGRPVSQRSH